MREFVKTLTDFTKGLRPDANMPRNSGFASELYNSRCGVAGLEVPPLIVYPISGAPTISWPLPQLVKVMGLRQGDTGLHFVNFATGNLVVSEVLSDYTLEPVFTKASTASRFTVADFGFYQIWTNGVITIKRAITDSNEYEWSEITINGAPLSARCVCNFRGQLIAGIGKDSAKLLTESGLGIITEDGSSIVTEGIGGFVIWSEIGSVNPAVMFDRSYGYIDRKIGVASLPVQPYKRTSGNYRVGPNSIVHRVLPLGNGVMVYCSDKIFYMKAVSTPEPTFGIVPVAAFGIPSTFCAEGDENEHLIVDSSKDLWRIKEGPKAERLGYKEFIGAMSGTIVISKSPNYGDYYISNGSKTYILSPFGLTGWFQYPTSLVWDDANKRLIGPIAVATDVSVYMATDVMDFGVRALKTITTMEIGSTGQIMTANIDYKYKVTDAAFTASRFKTASNFGAVTPIVSGIEFKFRVKGADYTKFDLDYLNVRYKYVDKRMLRGVYAKDAKVLP